MRSTSFIRASVLLAILTAFTPVARSQDPTILNYPGALGTMPTALNNSGAIVGNWTVSGACNIFGYCTRAFLYENGVFSNVFIPGSVIGSSTIASGVSDSGQIVGTLIGGIGGFSSGPSFGFLYDGGTITQIMVPGSLLTEPEAISSNGAYIVGIYETSGPTFQGFLYTGGSFTTINYPNAVYTFLTGVNNNGTISGYYEDAAGKCHAFLYADGTFTVVNYPSATSTFFYGINNGGTVTGSYLTGNLTAQLNTNDPLQPAESGGQAFLYNSGNFTTDNAVGTPTRNNDNGALVGVYAESEQQELQDGEGQGFTYDPGEQGYVNPKYLIMGVTYAPPGGSASSVSYQNTSTVGNTSTVSHSFTNGVTTSVSVSETVKAEDQGTAIAGGAGGKLTETLSAGWSQKTTNSNSVTVTRMGSIIFKTPGVPSVYSPVQHDYDIIWLWLNPLSIFTLPNTNIGGPVIWNGYGYDLNDPLQDVDVWPIYVGYLNGDFGPLDAQDEGVLSRSWVNTQLFGPGQGPGITSSDFANILKADPFAYNPYDSNSGYVLTLAPGTTPATSTDGRFTASSPVNTTPESIPYKQASPNTVQGLQETYQSGYSTMTTATQSTDVTYMVSFGVEASTSATYSAFTVGADFQVKWSMTWEDMTQTSNSDTSGQSDTAVIASPPCPATVQPCNPEYTEPHEFAVYQDNLYGSFMFWPNPYFSISQVAPATNTVGAGGAATYNVTTMENAGYPGGSLSFDVTGLPAGASINQNMALAGNPFALVVSTQSTTPTGSYPLTITATDGSQSYFSYATLVVKTPDFALSSAPSSETVSAGMSAPITVTVTPQGSFANPISLSCSGLPALAICSFSPSTVTPNSAPQTVNLTITTMGKTAFLPPPGSDRRYGPLYAVWLALSALLLGTAGLAAHRRRKLLGYGIMCLLVGGCLLLAACSTGTTSSTNNSTSSGGTGSSGVTPAGMYTITIIGAAGSTQHTTAVTLIVQ